MKQYVFAVILIFTLGGCSTLRAHYEDAHAKAVRKARSDRLAGVGVKLLDPSYKHHDFDRGRAYLEYALRNGNLKTVEMPQAALLDLLQRERVAEEKNHNLEQQLEIMKEIDTTNNGGKL